MVRLESGRVGIARRRAASLVGLAALAVLTSCVLLLPLAERGMGIEKVLRVGLLAPIAAAVARRVALAAPKRRGAIELRASQLFVTTGARTVAVPERDLLGALVAFVEGRTWLEIAVRGGDVVRVEITDEDEAAPLLDAFERAGLQRRLEIRARAPRLAWMPLGALAPVTALITFVLFAIATATVAGGHVPTWLCSFGAALIVTWGIVHARASPLLALGRDGLEIGRAFSSRFVPYDAIAEIEGPTWLRLAIARDGAPPEVVMIDGTGSGSMERTVKLVREARDRHRARRHAGDGDESELGLLDARGGRSAAEWQRAIAERVHDAGRTAYREIALSRASLDRVLDDGAAPPLRRIAAAVALRSLDETAADRIRVAADACANEHLRIALEKVARDELDDGAIDDAVAVAKPR